MAKKSRTASDPTERGFIARGGGDATEKPARAQACVTCGGVLEERSGTGRPAVYCGEPCRRLAEFKIRSLVRRVDRDEDELREVLARCGRGEGLDENARRARRSLLRRWIAEDRATLLTLLGRRG